MSNFKNAKKHFVLEKTKNYKDTNTYKDSCNICYQAIWNAFKYSKKKYSTLGAILPRQSF